MLEAWFENHVVAWVGIVVGTALLVFSGLALPKSSKISSGDGVLGTHHVTGALDCGKGWRVAWPIIGTTVAVLLLGLAVQGLWTSRRKRKRPGA